MTTRRFYGGPPSSGRLAWQASLPAFVAAPPLPVTGGFLVQPADLVYACALAG
jgi:hypothetical protein